MSAHTPGPWHVLPGADMVFTVGSPYGNGPMHIADPRGWGHMTGRGGGLAWPDDKAIAVQAANASLIAAAPELLEALDHLLREITNDVQALACVDLRHIEQARAAISKAKATQ